MALNQSIDADDLPLLMLGQFVISVILAAINAGIVGWQFMGAAIIEQPEVIMWYYTAASFLVLVFYSVLLWLFYALFEGNESGRCE